VDLPVDDLAGLQLHDVARADQVPLAGRREREGRRAVFVVLLAIVLSRMQAGL
jgi:hypothetical protein